MAKTAKESTEIVEEPRKRGKWWLIIPVLVLGALAIASFTILRRNNPHEEE